MPEMTTKTLLIRRVVQLLLTEALSIWLFFPGRGLGEGFSLRTGILAPVTLAFFPLWALKERNYAILAMTLLANIACVSIIGFSIMKKIKWIGGICLLLFTGAGIMLVSNGM
jgi:hypothetical protein